MDDLLGVSQEAINKDRLYRAHTRILQHKEAIEKHLKERFITLFDTQFDLMFYDITSTYFEGEAKANPQAKRGYSRDKRSDCKQVCIGLVVTREGLPVAVDVSIRLGQRSSTGHRRIGPAQDQRCGAADLDGPGDPDPVRNKAR